MRFLVDENVGMASVTALRAENHDAIHAAHIGLAGARDPAVIERATAEDRVLVTRDHHFTNPARFPPDTHPGIIFLRPGDMTSEEEAALLVRVVARLPATGIAGRLVAASLTRVTIR